jgi:hypothetical protein
MKQPIDLDAVHQQLVSALEQERASHAVVQAALPHAGPASVWLRWKAVGEEAQRGERALLAILADLGLDPERESPGRRAVRAVGQGLLRSLQQAPRGAAPQAAARCLARRERGNWELLGQLLAPTARRAAARAERPRPARAAACQWLERAAQFRLQRAPLAAAAGG